MENGGLKAIALTATSTPAYLISDRPAESIRFVRSARAPIGGQMKVLCDPVKPASPKQAAPGLQFGDKILRGKENSSQGGYYRMETVDDADLGRRAMKLVLDRSRPVPNKFILEACVLWFDRELEFDGRDFDEIGVWIKGNGGWGNVTLSLTGDHDKLNLQPCPYRNRINFDGWQLVKTGLKGRIKDDGKDHRLRVRSIGVSTSRNALNPLEMVPVGNDLVIGPVVGIRHDAAAKTAAGDPDSDWAMRMVDEKDL